MVSGCFRSGATECPGSLIVVRDNFLWEMNCVGGIRELNCDPGITTDIVRGSPRIFHPPNIRTKPPSQLLRTSNIFAGASPLGTTEGANLLTV